MLVVAKDEPWPLDHGGRLRLFHLLRGLARRARVTLLLPDALHRPQRLPRGIRSVVAADRVVVSHPEIAWRRAGALHTRDWAARFAARNFRDAPSLAPWLRRFAAPANFDVALLYGQTLGHYARLCRVPVVWDLVDDLALYALREAQLAPPRRWLAQWRWVLQCAAYERCAARFVRTRVVCSAIDAGYARRWAPSRPVEVVPNGVEVERFTPDARSPDMGALLFFGRLDFPPNIDAVRWFVSRVWPALYARDRGRRLRIVGRAAREELRAVCDRPGVDLIGEVADLRPQIAAAQVVIVPTRAGGGVKNKILEACAVGRPVVASRRAIGALGARPGVEIVCADAPGQWLARLDALLRNPLRAARIGRAAAAWVRAAPGWDDASERLHRVLIQAGQRAPGGPGASDLRVNPVASDLRVRRKAGAGAGGPSRACGPSQFPVRNSPLAPSARGPAIEETACR